MTKLSGFDEMEKIEKKARTFINSYIRNGKENGDDPISIVCDIEIFADDLDFISDYICDKFEKLQK
mgnify:CR=1 FL=1